ncbi:hypothetical protein LHP98_17250 [Rhodobacter sp. Har01]|uniref:hypothetical protein n=1 Tax=Rhodobacter sp. Har01 TaxID=2883999 RepID=UPI001D060E73|nr:hypothetical protein [Rhodobacter sp. Har01]MCB6179871.1 hypothetical protein [Rhodobacter sp. Har01]
MRLVPSGDSGLTGDGHLVIAIDDIPVRALRRMAGTCTGVCQASANGILRFSPADVPGLLPAAPQGWKRRDWTMAEAEVQTGATFREMLVAVSTTNDIRDDFAETAAICVGSGPRRSMTLGRV